MSFWGMSPAGKQAQGFPREYGQWNFDQYQQWLDKQNQFGNVGDWLRDQNIGYWAGRRENPFPSPWEIRQTGEQIMPGVDEATQRMWERWNQIHQAYQGMTPAWQTAQNMGQNVDEYAQYANLTADQLAALSNELYGSSMGRETAGSADIIKNFMDLYGGLEGNINAVYGDLRGKAGGVYDDLLAGSGKAFDESMEELELLKPGSEAAAARSARAFAPEMARTMGRLRRFGIDPNSPEAASLLRQVGVGRARAIDDQLAEGTERYVRSRTGLRLGKEAARRDLSLGKFGTESDLARQQTGLTTGLGREKASAVSAEKRFSLDQQHMIDARRTAQQMGIADQSFERAANWLNQKNNVQALERAMERQDWTALSQIMQGMNEQEVQAIDMILQQYRVGQQQEAIKLSESDRAMANLLGMSEQQYANQFRSGQMAQGFGDRAFDAFLKTLGIESQNAGWGTKLLSNLGIQALGLIPGVGPYMRYFMGQGGRPGGGGGGRGGNWEDVWGNVTGGGGR